MSTNDSISTSLPVANGNGPGHGNGDSGDDGGRARRRRGLLVRYGAMADVGEFSSRPDLEIRVGDRVVVQTQRGIELGEHIGPSCPCHDRELFARQVDTYVANSGQDFCRSRAGRILRRASEQDIREQNHLNAHVNEDIDHCVEVAHRLRLDMKVITCEHLLGGERIVFYFGSPGRVDFRQLVKELAQRYRTRIEMRQVGARDEARLVADYEVCGRECCCKNFLKKLRPVSMKMAKLQKSTLDPSKVSGRCGRLRCCLRYENDGYEELAERLPRVGARVGTAFGMATVTDRQILTQLVQVRTDADEVVVIPQEELLDPSEVPAVPARLSSAPRTDAAPTPVRTEPAASESPPAPAEAPPGAGPAASSGTTAESESRHRSRRRRRRPNAPRPENAGSAPAPSTDVEGGVPPGSPPEADRAPGGERGERGEREERGESRRKRRRRRRHPDRRDSSSPGTADGGGERGP